MAIDFSLTYADIEKLMRPYSLSDISDDVDESVETHTFIAHTIPVQIGVDVDDVTETNNRGMFLALKRIVKLRVAADLFPFFSHEVGDVVGHYLKLADDLESAIREAPKAFLEDWKPEEHMGGFGYASEDELINSQGSVNFIGPKWENMNGG